MIHSGGMGDVVGLPVTPLIPLDWQSGSPYFRVGGVYVLWTRSYLLPSSLRTTDVVHVGQAFNIAERLDDHARDHEAAYPVLLVRPSLHVVWAAVNPILRDGVEAYVGGCLRPAGTYPDAQPVPVTLPLVR